MTVSHYSSRKGTLSVLAHEGLHQYLKLGREDLDSQLTYKELVKFQLLKPRARPE